MNENLFIKNSEWEVLTVNGWQDFEGIKKTTKDSYLEISYRLPNKKIKTLACSKGHQLLAKRGDETMFCFSDMLMVGDELIFKDNKSLCKIISIAIVEKEIELYDLVNVNNGFEYIVNDIVTHNCAHVEGIDDLWLGLSPTLSTGGSAILISSPSGVGTLFHRLWIGALTEQNKHGEGQNGFYPIELPWTVHPDRDEKWFEEQRAEIIPAKGERGVNQELLCSFMSSGDTFIKGEALDHVGASIVAPQNIQTYGRDEIWIWQPPKSGIKYVIGADVARGDGEDFSAFNIIDTQNSEVVADFKGKPPPDKFAELLITYGTLYNTALICQELNNVGIAAAIKLKDSKYPNLYYEKFMKNIYMTYMTKDVGDEMPGFTTNPNSRVEMLAKLENTIRNKQIKLYSKRLFQELQTFIWKGNKPQSQKGYNDDLVISLAIACQLYEATVTANPYEDISMAMSMLKGMSRDAGTLNTMTGQRDIQTHQVKLDEPGPITSDFQKMLEAIKKKEKVEEEKRKHLKKIYGPYSWVVDD